MAYAIIHHCVTIKGEGVTLPFVSPPTRGRALATPQGLCGAGDSATHDKNNLSDSISRVKGRSGLYFNPYYRVKYLLRENPIPQQWAKAEVIKGFSAG